MLFSSLQRVMKPEAPHHLQNAKCNLETTESDARRLWLEIRSIISYESVTKGAPNGFQYPPGTTLTSCSHCSSNKSDTGKLTIRQNWIQERFDSAFIKARVFFFFKFDQSSFLFHAWNGEKVQITSNIRVLRALKLSPVMHYEWTEDQAIENINWQLSYLFKSLFSLSFSTKSCISFQIKFNLASVLSVKQMGSPEDILLKNLAFLVTVL